MESPRSGLKKFFIGTLIGIVSTVPGVSGAVLAVCFGIYERVVADIADIVHKIRDDFWFLATIGLGIAFGIIMISFGLDYVIDNYRVASMLLFLGLILGQLPELWKFTEPAIKISAADIAAFAVGIVIMSFFLVLGASEEKVLSHDLMSCLYMVLIGVIFSVSHLAPGISGSTVLLAMGLLAPLMSTIAEFDILIIPLLVGVFIGLIGFAKIVHYALTNYRKSTYMMILGLTVGSIFVIIKESVTPYPEAADVLLGIVALFAGILISLWFSRIGRKASKEFSVK
ncbi:MAG: DUF368 domain-containing protein [Candidatus Methanoplasma sp.]|jgi:putative membrane protein|nr:DUF368 domain-containing protein [Candidatus Methanoplasma sp.]